jgi:hypothetical protein
MDISSTGISSTAISYRHLMNGHFICRQLVYCHFIQTFHVWLFQLLASCLQSFHFDTFHVVSFHLQTSCLQSFRTVISCMVSSTKGILSIVISFRYISCMVIASTDILSTVISYRHLVKCHFIQAFNVWSFHLLASCLLSFHTGI